MKLLTSALLALQVVIMGPSRHIYAPASCARPTLSNVWNISGSGTVCSGGACANGSQITSAADSIGGDTASTEYAPYHIYTTNAINGLAADYLNPYDWMNLATAIPTPATTVSFYTVVNFTSVTASTGMMMSSGTKGLSFELNGSKLILETTTYVTIGTGTTVLSPATWYTLGFTYNQTSGAWEVFRCSGGTCSNDGSGTNVETLTGGAVSRIEDALGGHLGGYMAEAGYYNGSIDLTALGKWSKCQYGI